MDRFAAHLVVGVEKRLGQEVPDMGAAKAVDNPSAVTSALDEAGESEFGEVLAGYCRATACDLGEGSHVGFFLPQRPQESYPSGIGQ
jgi:hypothetical protein